MSTEHDPQLGPVARRLAATQRVLSVEDEPDIAIFLRAYFRAAGYDLVHVDPDDTDAILAAVAEHQPDCILLDVRLRGFSGLDAYRRLRAQDRYAFMPIIIVSAHAAGDPTFCRPAREGLDAFVPKPFNTNTLAELVKHRIERAQELRERGRDEDLEEVMSQEYLEARLADALAVARGAGEPLSFALITLRSMDTMTSIVGNDGRNWVINQLLATARSMLPAGALFGLSGDDEVALLLPGHGRSDAAAVLQRVLEAVAGEFAFPGGATVPVDVVAGLAAYPENATDLDGLYMAADAALADAVDADELLQVAR